MEGKEVIMVMEGKIAELKAMIEPKIYSKYVTTNSEAKANL